MIRVYLLPYIQEHGADHVAGEAYIHDALLLPGLEPDYAMLTQDTTPQEHEGLSAVAIHWHDASASEIDYFTAHRQPKPVDPDYDLVCSLLHNSPDPIPYPDLCIAFRLVCKRLGYIF